MPGSKDIKADKKKEVTPVGELIKHEGYRRDPYLDTKEILTGGIGHRFTKKDYDNFKPEWSAKKKDAYWAERFEEDIANASKQASGIMSDYDINNEEVKPVLINMIFNMGATSVRGFKDFLGALKENRIDDAVKEMYINGKGDGPSDWLLDVGKNRIDDLAKRLKDAYKVI